MREEGGREGWREGRRDGGREGGRREEIRDYGREGWRRRVREGLFVFPISSAYVLNLINHINNYIYYNYPVCECRC